MPTAELVDGLLILIAGLLLILPGFVTSVVGLLLLLPPVRAFVRAPAAEALLGAGREPRREGREHADVQLEGDAVGRDRGAAAGAAAAAAAPSGRDAARRSVRPVAAGVAPTARGAAVVRVLFAHLLAARQADRGEIAPGVGGVTDAPGCVTEEKYMAPGTLATRRRSERGSPREAEQLRRDRAVHPARERRRALEARRPDDEIDLVRGEQLGVVVFADRALERLEQPLRQHPPDPGDEPDLRAVAARRRGEIDRAERDERVAAARGAGLDQQVRRLEREQLGLGDDPHRLLGPAQPAGELVALTADPHRDDVEVRALAQAGRDDVGPAEDRDRIVVGEGERGHEPARAWRRR